MKPNPEETERLRAAFVSTNGLDTPTADCLAPDEILAALRDELSPGELRRVLGHVAVCSVCTEAWRLAQALESEISADENLPQHIRFGWRKAATALAAAVLVVVVGVVAREQWRSPEPVTRAAGAPVLALQAGGEPLPRTACLLRWTRFEGSRYDVSVSTEDLDTLSKAVDLDRPEYLVPEAHLPDTLLDTQGSGQSLLVYIEVHRPGEGTIASGTFPFEVR